MIAIAAFAVVATSCKTLSKQDKGVIIGASGGGVVGGVIGKATGNTARGAVIGAVVGGVAGGIIGRKMDKQAEEIKEVVGADAEVKREGEGIVIEFRDKVLFDYDRSDLSGTARTNLEKLATVLNKYPDTNIEILGHTDDRGTDAYNQRLSERRANSATAYLRTLGISSSRLKTRGLGESDPKVSNDTDAGRAENRRVEFVITANEKMIQDAKREAGQ